MTVIDGICTAVTHHLNDTIYNNR